MIKHTKQLYELNRIIAPTVEKYCEQLDIEEPTVTWRGSLLVGGIKLLTHRKDLYLKDISITSPACVTVTSGMEIPLDVNVPDEEVMKAIENGEEIKSMVVSLKVNEIVELIKSVFSFGQVKDIFKIFLAHELRHVWQLEQDRTTDEKDANEWAIGRENVYKPASLDLVGVK